LLGCVVSWVNFYHLHNCKT